jgi:hypothetical protein
MAISRKDIINIVDTIVENCASEEGDLCNDCPLVEFCLRYFCGEGSE